MIHIVLITFNTTELTNYCIRSINKTTPDCTIHVIDNGGDFYNYGVSDKFYLMENINPDTNNVIIYDNSNRSIFEYVGDKFNVNPMYRGSADHSYTIQQFIDQFNEPVLICESDVIVKKDLHEITDLLTNNTLVVAGAETIYKQIRFKPYGCYINVPLIKKLGISFFSSNRMYGLGPLYDGDKCTLKYDTGVSFYEDCIYQRDLNKNYLITYVKLNTILEHLWSISWKYTNSKDKIVSILNKVKQEYSEFI